MYSVLRYTFHDFQTQTTTTEGLGFWSYVRWFSFGIIYDIEK